jgi:endonuclease YncB( thermonuclease family)
MAKIRLLLVFVVLTMSWAYTGIFRMEVLAQNVSGNTYTSPQFGFSVTWDDTWFVSEEESDKQDYLLLTNGLAYAEFIGDKAIPGISAQLVATGFATSNQQDSHVTNFAQMKDAAGNPIKGGDKDHYWIAVSYTYTYDDGTVIDLANYVDVRTVLEGESILIFNGATTALTYDATIPLFEALLASIVLPAPPPPELVKGEPAPVFASGNWRIGVAAVGQNGGLDSAGLKEKDGHDWVLIVADVTNWSNSDATFDAREFFVRTAESKHPSKLAVSSSKKAARKLELPEQLEFEIPAGNTARVALAFSVPAGATDPVLLHDEDFLPLGEEASLSVTKALLSELAGPPDIQEATIVSVSDGATMKVRYKGESKSHKVRLLGVDAPTSSECGAKTAKRTVTKLKGSKVWLESDSEVKSAGTTLSYMWVEQSDGTRTLLNQTLVADGLVRAGTLPEDARFQAWIYESERQSKADELGIWTDCFPKNPPPAASPLATPLATPDSN